MTHELQLRLLGNIEILQDGNLLPGFRYSKSLALLSYLAVTGRAHNRPALAGLLWGDMAEATARRNLTKSLTDLRRRVGVHLTISHQAVAFNRDSAYWLDVEQFEARLGTGPEAMMVERLQAAFELYRGDFLEGFYVQNAPEFETWVLAQQARLRELALQALHQLAGHYSQQGQAGRTMAIDYTTRLLALEPWREEAHRQLMLLLVHSGQRSSALTQYETCCQVLAEELGVEPDPETTSLFEQIQTGRLDEGRTHRFDGLTSAATPSANHAQSLVDLGQAPDILGFTGREAELAELSRWLVTDRCRIITLLGMGGIGKTALAAKLIYPMVDQLDAGKSDSAHTFDVIIWRSLLNAPSLDVVLSDWLQTLAPHQPLDLARQVDDQIQLLLKLLRQYRCLLVLDNVEAILSAGDQPAGHYRRGYEDYGQLIQRIGESRHQSCLLLTSREKPKELARLEGDAAPVRTLQLSSLSIAEGRTMLKDTGLTGLDESWTTLIARYSGNPLALKVVTETIRELFGGDIAEFLRAETTIFGDIRDLLAQQFRRLSALEQELMIWLAIEREPVGPDDLRANLVQPAPTASLLEALQALLRRSLLEKTEAGFTLQNVVMEYITDHLIETVCREIQTPQSKINHLNRFALIKAQARDYLRASQTHLILQPVTDRLLSEFVDQDRLEIRLKALLSTLRQLKPRRPGYAGGNILNLLLHLGSDLADLDFSGLAVWQAYLRGRSLADVNFSQADLAGVAFTDTFTRIFSVAFSPDGRFLAAGGGDGQIRLWRSADGQPSVTCQGHTNWIRSLCFSPDGRILASASADWTVRLWDPHTGQCLKTLRAHTNEVLCVCFSPDGRILASSSSDQTICLWDVANPRGLDAGQLLRTLPGHTEWVWSVDFSPDSQILASGSADQTVRLWSPYTGQHLRTITGHTDWVWSIAFSPDGQLLASSSSDQTICLWDVANPRGLDTGQALRTLEGHQSGVRSVRFSPDGQILASGSNDQTVRLWDVGTGQPLRTLTGHSYWIWSISFSPDGHRLASGSGDQTVRLWDVANPRGLDTGRELRTLRGYDGWVMSVCFSPDGHLLASGSANQTVHLWHLPTGREIQRLQGHTGFVWAVCFSPDGRILASGSADQMVRLWDVQSGQLLRTLQGHNLAVYSVCFSPDGNLLASSGHDSTIRLWDIHTGQSLATLRGHTSWVRSVCFSPDGNLLASSGHDNIVQLWDVANPRGLDTGQPLRTLPGNYFTIQSICFSPDSTILAGGSLDQTVRLWDVANPRGLDSGQLLRTLQGHEDHVYSVCFSPDGQMLASASDDHTVRLWGVANPGGLDTGQLLRTLPGHSSAVWSVHFSPAGHMVASGSEDETIKVWDVQSGTCLKTLRTDRPYERMNISGATGLSQAQKETLKALGAIEE